MVMQSHSEYGSGLESKPSYISFDGFLNRLIYICDILIIIFFIIASIIVIQNAEGSLEDVLQL
jgi:hypothetical protein